MAAPRPARTPSDHSKVIVMQPTRRPIARAVSRSPSLCRFSQSCQLQSFLSLYPACSLHVGAFEGGEQTSREAESGVCASARACFRDLCLDSHMFNLPCVPYRLLQALTAEQHRAFCRVGAITRGFLTRRLLKTEKVKHLRQTIVVRIRVGVKRIV